MQLPTAWPFLRHLKHEFMGREGGGGVGSLLWKVSIFSPNFMLWISGCSEVDFGLKELQYIITQDLQNHRMTIDNVQIGKAITPTSLFYKVRKSYFKATLLSHYFLAVVKHSMFSLNFMLWIYGCCAVDFALKELQYIITQDLQN